MRLYQSLVFYLFIVMVDLSVLQEFYRYGTLNGYTCPLANVMFNFTSLGEAQCAMQCSKKFTCMGAFFLPSSKTCIGCSSEFNPGAKEILATSIFYKRKYRFKYLGCMEDSSYRILSTLVRNFWNMTIEGCIELCMLGNYTHVLLEYYVECYCGNGFRYTPNMRPESECNTSCWGNPSQKCGDKYRGSGYLV